MPRSILARTLIATAALTALGLAAATPASAHTDVLYGHVEYKIDTAEQGFITVSKTDAAVAPISLHPYTYYYISGMELVDEVGTAIGLTSADRETYVVLDWNHVTGAYGVPVAMYITGAQVTDVEGLTARADGTLLTYVEYLVGDQPSAAFAILDRGTGELTPVIDVTGFTSEFPYYLSELVTDPATGTDYALLRSQDSGRPAFMSLDVAAHDTSDPIPFGGADFALAEFGGADFTADGTLYFYLFDYVNENDIALATLGAPSTWTSANPVIVGPLATDVWRFDFRALTAENTVLANTGSELPVAAVVLLGLVAMVAGGIAVVVARRRMQNTIR